MSQDSQNHDPALPVDLTSPMRALHHDLKNHLTAMRSGCALLERVLGNGDVEQAKVLLDKMREELTDGVEIAERLKDWEEPET